MWRYWRLLAKQDFENADDSIASTVGLLDDHEGCENRGPPRKPRSHTFAVQTYIAVAATVVCVLQIYLMTLTNGMGIATKAPSDIVSRRFSRNVDYMTLDHQFDHLWHWENHTFIRVPEPELDTDQEIPAGIAMFHQLHCLASFRSALQKAYEGEQIGFDQRDNHHWPHCFDYLRQTILCHADTTLELPRVFNGTIRTRIIDGVDDVRQCRSAQAVENLGGISWRKVLDSLNEV